MQLLTGLLLTSCILVQADSEAFFLPNILSRSSSRNHHHPSVRHHHLRQASKTQFRPGHRQHKTRGQRPTRQLHSIFPPLNLNLPHLGPQPVHHAAHGRHPRVHPPPQQVRTDPGARMKLDYGGWTPIDFDEDLPSKLKRGIKIEDLKSVSESVKQGNKIVTIDTAIAAAPAAESDDLTHVVHHQHHVPAPAQPSQPIYIPSTADQSNIVYVDSSNAPVATYDVLEANNPAVAPQYEPSNNKPSFQAPQYIPRPAVPSKPYQSQPPALAPKYQTPVTAAPTQRPRYQPRPAVPVQTPAIPPQYEPAGAVLPAHVPQTTVDSEKYPIVALITADSDVPEKEKFVEFSINGGSPDSLLDQDTLINLDTKTRNTKNVASSQESDELYYIYYQDPELDPSFGVKVQQERDASNFLGVEGLDIPLYDYDEAADLYRTERDQPRFGAKSSSSVSFKQSVGGQSAQFSYNLS